MELDHHLKIKLLIGQTVEWFSFCALLAKPSVAQSKSHNIIIQIYVQCTHINVLNIYVIFVVSIRYPVITSTSEKIQFQTKYTTNSNRNVDLHRKVMEHLFIIFSK